MGAENQGSEKEQGKIEYPIFNKRLASSINLALENLSKSFGCFILYMEPN